MSKVYQFEVPEEITNCAKCKIGTDRRCDHSVCNITGNVQKYSHWAKEPPTDCPLTLVETRSVAEIMAEKQENWRLANKWYEKARNVSIIHEAKAQALEWVLKEDVKE